MKVSVVVPVFETNVHYFAGCMDSLLCQSLDDYEIILVDDGSKEPKLLALLEEYAKDQRVHLVRHEQNQGLPASRNTGIALATGEFILNVDSDDQLASSSVLQSIYETALLDGCDVLRFNGCYWVDDQCDGDIFMPFECVNRTSQQNPELCEFRSVFCFLIRRAFLLENQLKFNPDISVGEDTEFLGRLLSCASKISSINSLGYRYRRDNLSMMRSQWTEAEFLSEDKAFMSLFDAFGDCTSVLLTAAQFRINEYLPFKICSRLLSDVSQSQAMSLIDHYEDSVRAISVRLELPEAGLFELKMRVLRLFLGLPLLSGPIKSRAYRGIFIFYRLVLRYLHLTVFFVPSVIKNLALRARCRRDEDAPPLISKNVECLRDYDLSPHFGEAKIEGLSVMYRVKNEEKFIQASILSIIDLADQIVVVDNASADQTVQRVNELKNNHPEGSKIEIFTYPFEVARCGGEHDRTEASSVHSLSYFYNWCLDQCQCRAVLKWDGDMIFTSDAKRRHEFLEIVRRFQCQELPQFCFMGAENVYIDDESKVLSLGEIFSEVRLFIKHPSVYFIKGERFEVLNACEKPRHHFLEDSMGYEVKDLCQNEFSHWSNQSFDRPRKVQEFRTFSRLRAGLDRDKARIVTDISIQIDKTDLTGIPIHSEQVQ